MAAVTTPLRALILGAGGQLGQELAAALRGAGHDVTGCTQAMLDVRDEGAVLARAREVRPDVILNCAAHTKVDACEREEALALALNGTAVEGLARVATAVGAKLVHFSTDYVFDGRARVPHGEEDPVSPASAYGRSKLAGESAALTLGERALVVRTQWLYGPGTRNFVYAIASRAARGEPLRVVADQVGSPTHTHDVAAAVLALLQRGAHGLFHATNAGEATWFEFAAAILALGGWRTSVTPTETDLSQYPAPRPAYSVLRTDKLRRATGLAMRPWRDALAHYLSRDPWSGTLSVPSHGLILGRGVAR